MPRSRFFLSILTALGFVLPTPLDARDMLDGSVIPDKFIIHNHPAAKEVRGPISRKLLPHGLIKTGLHCFFLRPDGAVGNVTMQSISYVVLKEFPLSVFECELLPSEIELTNGGYLSWARTMVTCDATRKANGDWSKARSIIRAAEKADADCFRMMAKERYVEMHLLKQNMLKRFDRDLNPVVYRINPNPPRLAANSGTRPRN